MSEAAIFYIIIAQVTFPILQKTFREVEKDIDGLTN